MSKPDSIVLGGGCFWCLEAIFERIKGVRQVTSGYAGGLTSNPTYESIHTQNTNHAEVVKIEFDSNLISLDQLLECFWHIHDPTTPNRQGGDVGTAYRSIILYNSENQKTAIDDSLANVATNLWDNPIVTDIDKLENFYKAEDYHQNYFNKNPSQTYCQIVINPKISKFEKKFTELLK